MPDFILAEPDVPVDAATASSVLEVGAGAIRRECDIRMGCIYSLLP